MSELFEYKQAMDGLHFTEAQKKALAAQALRVAEQGGAAWAYCQAGGGHCEADWEKQVPGFMDFLWMR